jgi:hypothetical protein
LLVQSVVLWISQASWSQSLSIHQPSITWHNFYVDINWYTNLNFQNIYHLKAQ